MSDFDVILNYLPPEGHPQDVEEADCPYCALRRIETRIAELEAENKRMDDFCREFVWGEDNPHEYKTLFERAEQAEAELAALKAEYEAFKAHHRGGGCGCNATVREFVSIDGMVEE